VKKTLATVFGYGCLMSRLPFLRSGISGGKRFGPEHQNRLEPTKPLPLSVKRWRELPDGVDVTVMMIGGETTNEIPTDSA
jgi:hypothetical protein